MLAAPKTREAGVKNFMVRLFHVGLLAAGLCTLLMSSAPAASDKHADDRAELTALVHEECEGVLENHAATLERIWADEFQMHTVDGRVTPKAQARAYLRAALPQSIAGVCEIDDLSIKIDGKRATTEGRMMLRATNIEGQPEPKRFRFTQRLVKRDGRWQALRLDFSYITDATDKSSDK